MCDSTRFEFIKDKYGYVGIFAIWAEEGATPKSNVGDLSVFDLDRNKQLLKILNPHIILVGLNISGGSIKVPLANFHDSRSEAMDYKIRYAFKSPPFWGA